MAASKTYFARVNYRFLPTDQTLTKGSTMFELANQRSGTPRPARARRSSEKPVRESPESHRRRRRQMARTRMASFSVHEGIGRTLKGRDLSTVRNAIWEKTGFQDWEKTGFQDAQGEADCYCLAH
ncbi:hypothetical protein Fot_18201 [Forsythia ovata]|uniref:Uncharacterized protein n=1 Tax=Forsythia ovata TaxID=205694 RepID=A0ABD1VK83_9LAMI